MISVPGGDDVIPDREWFVEDPASCHGYRWAEAQDLHDERVEVPIILTTGGLRRTLAYLCIVSEQRRAPRDCGCRGLMPGGDESQ